MKSISPAMRAHLNGEVTTLASCWRIQRTDGKTFTFTDHDQNLVVAGLVYRSSSGFSRTAIATASDLSIDNLEVIGTFTSEGLLEEEMRAGLFDHAAVYLFMVNWSDLTMGTIQIRRGWMGQTVLTKQGAYQAELRGMFQALSQNIGEVYSYNCRADLGDSRRRVPLLPATLPPGTEVTVGQIFRVASGSLLDALGNQNSTAFKDKQFTVTQAGTTAAVTPAYDYTPGNSTTDGTAELVCAEAYARVGIVSALDATGKIAFTVSHPNGVDPREVTYPLDWFVGGQAQWESGANYPSGVEITGCNLLSDNLTALSLPLAMPFPAVPGDRCVLTPGCQRYPTVCVQRFNNILNYRGEPYVPGTDFILYYPDPTG